MCLVDAGEIRILFSAKKMNNFLYVYNKHKYAPKSIDQNRLSNKRAKSKRFPQYKYQMVLDVEPTSSSRAHSDWTAFTNSTWLFLSFNVFHF